jgi:hypothetical protein
MHVRLGAHHSAAILTMGLLGVFGLGGTVNAEPVTHQDTVQSATDPTGPVGSILDSPELLTDDLTGQNKAGLTANPAQGRPAPTERTTAPAAPTKAAPATSPAPLPNAKPDPSLGAEIRSTVKESVRPLHDQMVESGAVDAWKELKADLGLGKSEWNEEGANAGNPKTAGPLDGPNAGRWQEPQQRPKTAAQTQMDQELASHMLEKLIDEVKPWALSLLALYILGYLIKAGIGHSQRRSIRRQERETRRVLRRASSKAADTKPKV